MKARTLGAWLTEAQQRSEIEGALGVWQTIVLHIDSGVPIDGLRSMAGYNIKGLQSLAKEPK